MTKTRRVPYWQETHPPFDPPGAQVRNVPRAKGMRLEIFRDLGNGYRWRKVARNGQKVSVAGESFRRKDYAVKAARREHPKLPIFDLTLG